LKLVCQDSYGRYTAEQALNHPWITRKFNQPLPLTATEKMLAFEKVEFFKRVSIDVWFTINYRSLIYYI